MLKLKLNEEWEDFLGFTVKKNFAYGKVKGKNVVITQIPYAYNVRGEVCAFVLTEEGWEYTYLDESFFKSSIIKVGGLFYDLIEFLKSMEWSTEPDELERIYFNSNLPKEELDKYRGLFDCWNLEDAAEVREMEEEEEE